MTELRFFLVEKEENGKIPGMVPSAIKSVGKDRTYDDW
jgi:hypothetical protein